MSIRPRNASCRLTPADWLFDDQTEIAALNSPRDLADTSVLRLLPSKMTLKLNSAGPNYSPHEL